MWFGPAPKRSRAAAPDRVLSDADLVKRRQKEIQNQIRGFVREEKLRNEQLAEHIDDLVQQHSARQQQQRGAAGGERLSLSGRSSSGVGGGGLSPQTTSPPTLPALRPPPALTMLNPTALESPAGSGSLVSPAASTARVRISPSAAAAAGTGGAAVASSSSLTPRANTMGHQGCAKLNVDILRTCGTVVKGIDNVMNARARAGAQAMHSITESEFNHNHAARASSVAGGIGANSSRLEISRRAAGAAPATTTLSSAAVSGGGTNDGNEDTSVSGSVFGSGQSRISARREQASSVLDAEELEEDLRRLRRVCFEDAYLDHEVVSCNDGEGGYGSEPPLANLGPVSSVVGSVGSMKESGEKVFTSLTTMMDILDNSISLRKDMMQLRQFKRNLSRSSFHARRVLNWANQCRTHMFIFNNTINHVTRDAADNLRKTGESKKKAEDRIEQLKRQHEEVDLEIARAYDAVAQLSEEHGELQKQCQVAFSAIVEQRKASSTYNESAFGATAMMSMAGAGAGGGGGLFSNMDDSLSSSQASASVFSAGASSPTVVKKKDARLDTAAHHAIEKMSVSGIELYLLLDRYTNAVLDPKMQTTAVKNAVQRILTTIEQIDFIVKTQ